MNKDTIVAILKQELQGAELIVEDQADGSTMIIGPFPSFIFLVNQPGRPDGYMLSVNADAPNAHYYILEVLKELPLLQYYGPYAENLETNEIIGGPEAYKMKEDFVINTAKAIMLRRMQEKSEQPPEIYVPEQKIVLA